MSETGSSTNKFRIELLVKEQSRVAESLTKFKSRTELVLSLGTVGAGGSLTYLSLNPDLNESAALVPLAALGVYLYYVYICTEIAILSGYKSYLEQRLNWEAGENVLMWDSVIAEPQRSAFGTIAYNAVFFLLLVLTVVKGLASVWGLDALAMSIKIGVTGLYIALLLIAILGVAEVFKSFERSFRSARAHAKESTQSLQCSQPMEQSTDS